MAPVRRLVQVVPRKRSPPRRPPQPFDREVGKRVKAARKARGWSQERLATVLDVAQSQVSYYEQGRSSFTPLQLFKLSAVLGIPVCELLGQSHR